MALPDPEMRRFLATGSEATVTAALSEHVAAGMSLAFDGNTYTLGISGLEPVTGPVNQQLKLTVRAANGLMEAAMEAQSEE